MIHPLRFLDLGLGSLDAKPCFSFSIVELLTSVVTALAICESVDCDKPQALAAATCPSHSHIRRLAINCGVVWSLMFFTHLVLLV
jgi:hypothetical protein